MFLEKQINYVEKTKTESLPDSPHEGGFYMDYRVKTN
jgi:hypothetical protein